MAAFGIIQGVVFNADNFTRLPGEIVTIDVSGSSAITATTLADGSFYANVPVPTNSVTVDKISLDEGIEHEFDARPDMPETNEHGVVIKAKGPNFMQGIVLLDPADYSETYSDPTVVGPHTVYTAPSGATLKLANSLTHDSYVRFVDMLKPGKKWKKTIPGNAEVEMVVLTENANGQLVKVV